jgi:hypothetical protein
MAGFRVLKRTQAPRVDIQDSYKYFAFDGFLDLPAGSAGVVTA